MSNRIEHAAGYARTSLDTLRNDWQNGNKRLAELRKRLLQIEGEPETELRTVNKRSIELQISQVEDQLKQVNAAYQERKATGENLPN